MLDNNLPLNENTMVEIKEIGKQLELLNRAYEEGGYPEEEFAGHLEGFQEKLVDLVKLDPSSKNSAAPVFRKINMIIKLHKLPLYQLTEEEDDILKIRDNLKVIFNHFTEEKGKNI